MNQIRKGLRYVGNIKTLRTEKLIGLWDIPIRTDHPERFITVRGLVLSEQNQLRRPAEKKLATDIELNGPDLGQWNHHALQKRKS